MRTYGNLTISPEHKPTSNSRLAPVYQLLSNQQYDQAAHLLDYRANPSCTLQFFNLFSYYKDEKNKEYSSYEIGQISAWLVENKADFATICFKSSLGRVLAKGTFADQRSPFLAALQDHPKFFELLKSYPFPAENIGKQLYQYIESHETERALHLLRYAQGPTYSASEHHQLHSDCFAQYIEPQTGNRPLHLACAEEKYDNKLINALIERGAFLTDLNKEKISPLDLILKRARNDNEVNIFLTAHFGMLSKEHLLKLLLVLAKKKWFEPARLLLLKMATIYKHDDITHLLYRDPITGNCILHFAADQKENPEFTKLLLQYSGPKSYNLKNKNQKTPLMLSIENDSDEITSLFLTDVKKMDSYHFKSAMLLLAKKDKIEIATHLFEAWFNLSGVKELIDCQITFLDRETHNTLAHYIALSKNPAKAKLLLLLCQNSVSIEHPDRTGITPIQILGEHKEFPLLESLFFTNYKTFPIPFSLDSLTQATEFLLSGTKNLNHLANFLLQLQEKTTLSNTLKQTCAKKILFVLIEQAKSENEVKNILFTLRANELKIPYFYQASGFWQSTPTCIKDVISRAHEKIRTFAPIKENLSLESSNQLA